MGYSNKTPNYDLPQWIGSDKPTWLVDMNGAFSNIDTVMEDNKTQAALANQKGDNNTSSINQINQTITNIQGAATGLANKVEQNTNNISLHTTHLNEHDADIQSLQSDVNSNMGDISALQSDVTQLQNEIGSGGNESTSIEARLTSLRNDVNTLNADVGSVNSLQTTAKTVVGAVNELNNKTTPSNTYTFIHKTVYQAAPTPPRPFQLEANHYRTIAPNISWSKITYSRFMTTYITLPEGNWHISKIKPFIAGNVTNQGLRFSSESASSGSWMNIFMDYTDFDTDKVFNSDGSTRFNIIDFLNPNQALPKEINFLHISSSAVPTSPSFAVVSSPIYFEITLYIK